MKEHNNDYKGNTISIEVVENGFVVDTRRSITRSRCVCNTFTELVNSIARTVGAVRIGESVLLASSDDDMLPKERVENIILNAKYRGLIDSNQASKIIEGIQQ